MPIFCVKSVKFYTGQKKFTRIYPWDPWQIWGMCQHLKVLIWYLAFQGDRSPRGGNLGHTSRTSANSATSACSSLVASSSGCSSLPASPLQVFFQTSSWYFWHSWPKLWHSRLSSYPQKFAPLFVQLLTKNRWQFDIITAIFTVMANISCSGLWRRLAVVSGRSEAWATSRFLSTSTQSHRLPSQVGALICYLLLWI